MRGKYFPVFASLLKNLEFCDSVSSLEKVKMESSYSGWRGGELTTPFGCSRLLLIACNDINDPVIAVRVALKWKTSS